MTFTAVSPRVGPLRVLHLLDVGASLRERDLRHAEADSGGVGLGDPAVDVGLAAVVGGQRERLVAVVVVEQVAQVVGAVGDAGGGMAEVGQLLAVAPSLAR